MGKGFALIDAIVGLFILGLISIILLTTMTSVYSNYYRIRAQTEMAYLGEGIYERLCSKDDYARKMIEDLTLDDEVIFDDLSLAYGERYESRIIKIGESEDFLDISIIIHSKSKGGNVSDVELKGSIHK